MKIEDLMVNPYAWLVLAIFTIASLVFAIYTWITGKRKKEISYIRTSYKIIEKGKAFIPQLQILYGDKNIKDLTITRYAVWNSGNEVLQASDIVESKPLHIFSDNEDCIILNADIVRESDETNLFKINEISESSIKIGYDYADPKDGLIIQIVHTGSASSLKFDGKIKGGKKIKKLESNDNARLENAKERKRRRRNKVMIYIAFFFLIMLSILLQYLGKIDGDTPPPLATLMFIIGSLYVIYFELEQTYRINIPDKLRDGIEYSESEDD